MSLITAELDWTSDDPHLSGAFAPIGPEIDAADLPVVAGRIPDDLSGAYMRNGPNPLFKPLAYTYPMDGDGMIHAVYFDNGRARYKNRFVRTRGLEVERRAGRAVYGGLLHPLPVDPALVGSGGEPGPIKTGAFINVLSHGDHLLALGEAQPPYEITPELETLGEWRAGADKPIRLGAHNRRHPLTGDLYGLVYTSTAPVVYIHHFDRSGVGTRTFPIALAAPSMIHDFVLTEGHIVLVVGPAIFDQNAAKQGKPFLQWRPEFGTRIGVAPLEGGSPVWIEAEPFFVYHFANGFERRGEIVLDYVRHAAFTLGPHAPTAPPPRLHRMTIDMVAKTVRDAGLAEFATEFPRINDAFVALPSRFVYAPTLTETLPNARPAPGTFNAIVKVDTETGLATSHERGRQSVGEPLFIPRGRGEDEGYVATHLYDPASAHSDLALLDAARIDAEPLAVIRLPQRVPQGLHGNWIAKR